MLGMFSDLTPKFAKVFAPVGEVMTKAFKDYINEVKSGAFPAEEHTFKIDDEVIKALTEQGE
jgi:3-methyl-2-oxobutanoate hydroxymethyltransferase